LAPPLLLLWILCMDVRLNIIDDQPTVTTTSSRVTTHRLASASTVFSGSWSETTSQSISGISK